MSHLKHVIAAEISRTRKLNTLKMVADSSPDGTTCDSTGWPTCTKKCQFVVTASTEEGVYGSKIFDEAYKSKEILLCSGILALLQHQLYVPLRILSA
jgi:hypothetical protein